MVVSIIKVITGMFMQLFKRGRGIFKFLFVIDDFFRLFTMTILIPIFFSWLGFGIFIINLGIVLGIVIDVHDFMSGAGLAKLNE